MREIGIVSIGLDPGPVPPDPPDPSPDLDVLLGAARTHLENIRHAEQQLAAAGDYTAMVEWRAQASLSALLAAGVFAEIDKHLMRGAALPAAWRAER